MGAGRRDSFGIGRSWLLVAVGYLQFFLWIFPLDDVGLRLDLPRSVPMIKPVKNFLDWIDGWASTIKNTITTHTNLVICILNYWISRMENHVLRTRHDPFIRPFDTILLQTFVC